ncbi:CpsD/CapB family tyrosine-protein kinase [Aliikangiella sp. G2MR2-5]|uniref:CpsD/CapB family tyrosine-protein kinase n=1 Tax=Aliikangiella sp. G2MR2-5 TaxID=2788943 RepID=UPI0018AB05E8|nr:CpsD/CapB family tyrosine-protein kinase [Aliikangiella sp. G2MR2-5]
MSIIESAYLKSKGKKDGKDSEDFIDEIVQSEKEVAESRSRPPKDLASARNQITQMAQDKIFTAEELAAKGLINPSMKDSVLLNKYRNLRTKLLTSTEKENFVTLVTSVVPSGGNSMVATNLAATFALDEGKTSLLVDANINNPQLASLLDVESDIGLIDYLESDEYGMEDVLKKTPIPRLRLLPSGKVRVSAAEYFTSEKMKSMMKDMATRYPERFPIIDAPSITQSADTRILIEMCDMVILVVPHGKCTKEEIRYAAMAIGNEKLTGIVLNEF